MKIKLLTLIAFALLFAAQSIAQNAMLTKEETVNYIQKKLLEVEGREEVYDYEGRVNRVKVPKMLISVKGNVVQLSVARPTGLEKHEFNPAYISKVELLKPKSDEGVGTVFVSFVRKVVRSTSPVYEWKPTDLDYVLIKYFATIPQNGDRMMKAILHLRDLAKAEEDPFGN